MKLDEDHNVQLQNAGVPRTFSTEELPGWPKSPRDRIEWLVGIGLLKPREPGTFRFGDVFLSPAASSQFPALEQADLLAMSEPVRLPGDGGARLEGRLFGSGEVGVVLAHMRPGDQQQWFELAGLLANNGYRVVTYNRRGSCPGGQFGCSGGNDDGGAWKDLAFVIERLREAGARRVVVGGASLGAMESLYALSRGLDAEGSSGSPASIYTEASRSPSRCAAFGSRSSSWRGSSTVKPGIRVFEEAAPEPARVITLDTGEHGTDILAYADVAVADEFREAVLDFLARI